MAADAGALIPADVRVRLDAYSNPDNWTHTWESQLAVEDGEERVYEVLTPLRPGLLRLFEGCDIATESLTHEYKDACIAYVRERLVAPWLNLLAFQILDPTNCQTDPPGRAFLIAEVTARRGHVAPGEVRDRRRAPLREYEELVWAQHKLGIIPAVEHDAIARARAAGTWEL